MLRQHRFGLRRSTLTRLGEYLEAIASPASSDFGSDSDFSIHGQRPR
jgi:hypothetical protein